VKPANEVVGPSLVYHSEAGPFSWEWPDDPEWDAEQARMADVYEARRRAEREAYDRKRAEYLAQVEREREARLNRACAVCGDPVPAGSGRLYCCRECEAQARRTRIDMQADPDAVSFCPVCDREVRQNRYSHNPRVYCSARCRYTARDRRRAGKPIRDDGQEV